MSKVFNVEKATAYYNSLKEQYDTVDERAKAAADSIPGISDEGREGIRKVLVKEYSDPTLIAKIDFMESNLMEDEEVTDNGEY